jgi:plasmid stabilization system protein ParE
MESQEANKYKVIITQLAEVSFYQLLDYFFEHYSLERAEELADELHAKVKDLHYSPQRGSLEPGLLHLNRNHRFILYQRTSRAEIKIIYYIDQDQKTVYVTDFFPTEKDNRRIKDRY